MKWHPSSVNLFASTDYAGIVRVWDTRSQVPIGTKETHSGKALCVNWLQSNDSNGYIDGDESQDRSSHKVVSGGSDCCIKLTLVS